MGWRDLIVSSHAREGAPEKPTESHFVDSVYFGSKYNFEYSSLSIEDSSRNSIPSKASTEYTEPPASNDDQPAAPLQPGWLVAYRDKDYRLRGGCDERDHGTVARLEWVHGSWTVWLTNGEALPLARIRSVGKTDATGQVIAAWTTRDCGYDGKG